MPGAISWRKRRRGVARRSLRRLRPAFAATADGPAHERNHDIPDSRALDSAGRALLNGTMPRTALITGVTGQDGSYLAEFLLAQGYRVVGMVRRSSAENFERIAHLQDRLELRQADLLDELSLISLLRAVRPD